MSKDDRFYEVCGRKLPSVTTITGVISKPALYFFYGKHGTAKAKKLSQEALDIGSAVHEYAERYFKGNFEGYTQPDDKKVQKACENLRKFQEIYSIKAIRQEHTVYNLEHGYAGTLDGIFKFKKKLIMLDFKTSTAIYDEYRLQLEAYNRCEMEEKIDELWVVRLDKENEFNDNKDVLKFEPDQETFNAFLACKGIYDWLRRKKNG